MNSENTSALLFDDKDEKYFLAVEGKAVGPLSARELYERVSSGQASLLNFVWFDGQRDWVRVAELTEFLAILPKKPTAQSIDVVRQKLETRRKAKAAAAPQPPQFTEPKNLYLYYNATQYGPFSQAEVEQALSNNPIHRNTYAWSPGWPNWKRVTEVPELAKFVIEEPAAKEPESRKEKTKRTGTASRATGASKSISDKRGAPRRPLVARLFLHNDKDVIVAVCRDISVGGMQVLTDRVPGPVGTKLKLNVSPGDTSKVKSFVAEGEIVRVLDDGRGFSFRFKKISEEARRAIEKFIREN